MGLLYQKRRLKVNKAKRRIAANRALLMRFRVFLSLVLSLAICWFGIWVLKLPQWYIDSNKLYEANPEVLTIQGNNITPYYKIINLIRQTQLPNTQIFRLSTEELSNNIAQLQSVRKVYIRRYWFPARLVVVLDERVPVFLLAPNLTSEPTLALTTDGVVLDHDYLPLNTNTKTIKLLTYGVHNGESEVWDKKSVEELLKLTKAIETYANQDIKYIDLRNRSDIYIMLEEYLIRFGEINDSAYSRAKWIASILPEAKNIKEKIKYIDLRWEDSRYFCLEDKQTKPNEQTNNSTPAINQPVKTNNQPQTQTPTQTQVRNSTPIQTELNQTEDEEQD